MSTRIGITLGDPSGVGPEIVAKTIAEVNDEVRQRLLIFCDKCVLERAFLQTVGEPLPADLALVDRGILSADLATPGQPSEAGAKAQVGYLEASISAARGNKIGGVVTAPISKFQAKRAGFEFQGHTEFFQSRLKVKHVVMMFVSQETKIALASTHHPINEVSNVLSIESISKTISLVSHSLQHMFGIEHPKVGVLGLNPHAGENGLLGKEELEIIKPAISKSAAANPSVDIQGPLVSWVGIRDAFAGTIDAAIAMYHDQGMMPVKLAGFDKFVNMTLGLPIIRTSPCHGVGYDIAGKGIARHESFMSALNLALLHVDKNEKRSSELVD